MLPKVCAAAGRHGCWAACWLQLATERYITGAMCTRAPAAGYSLEGALPFGMAPIAECKHSVDMAPCTVCIHSLCAAYQKSLPAHLHSCSADPAQGTTPGAYWGLCLKQCCLGSSSVLATAPEATAAAPATAVADDSALAAATRAHGAPATAPATAAVDVLVLLSFV